jgi:hypothetical protein
MGERRNAYNILIGKPEGRVDSEDVGIDGRIILEWILGKHGRNDVDYMHLAQDRDQWRALVNSVMNLWVP